MRLYCLNGDPNYPCFILSGKGCTLMLDCSLNMKSLQYFIPQMLVVNQRFENLPNYRNAQTGQVYENFKEFNNRIYVNSPLEFSVPEFNLINIEDIDTVLISNYNYMLALPYLTKLKGFRASVYCTEPVMHFGRMLMEELTSSIKSEQSIVVNNEKLAEMSSANQPKAKNFPLFRTLDHLAVNLGQDVASIDVDDREPPNKQVKIDDTDVNMAEDTRPVVELDRNDNQLNTLRQNYTMLAQLLNINELHMKPINWKYLYSKEDMELCMSKIKLIDFNERVSVFGSLVVQPKSSGHSIGSCNWTIEYDSDTIVYLSRSSFLSTHSKVFNQSLLKQQIIDCLLVTGLNQAQSYEPEQMIQDFCKACVMTIKNQGNVLVPVLPMGKIYDLLECLYRYLSEASLQNVPLYMISGVAEQSLAYSNIFAEWLCESKQNSVYAAESPFQHAELTRSGLFKIYPTINAKFNDDFHQPCILFASHPSLRFGEACHFVDLWKNSPNNSFIFTDPEFYYLDALAPYQPVYANYYYFPIDTSLTSYHVNKLLKEPKQVVQLVTSQLYKSNGAEQSTPAMDQLAKIDASKLSPLPLTTFYAQNDIIKLALKRKYEHCDIDADLAMTLVPNRKITVSNRDVVYTTFTAQLVTKNNHHTLNAAPKTIPLSRRDRINESNLKKYTYGKLNLDKFLSTLRQAGLNNFKLIEKTNTNEDGEDQETGREESITDEANQMNELMSYFSNKYLIEIDSNNKIDLDLNANKINVVCDNDDYRLKIKDSLLKCLKAF